MQRSFGLKDFVLYLLIIASLGVSTCAMWQDDRRFEQSTRVLQSTRDQNTTLNDVAAAVNRLTGEIQALRGDIGSMRAEGVRVSGAAPRANNAQTARDESWARPGVPVTWPRRWYEPINDPNEQPNFRRGGTITEIFEAKPAKITPYTYNDVYYARIVREVVCESLGFYNAQTLEIEGLLAEAWQYDPNGMWLRIKLDERARFSDGMPVTAEDVRWTYMDLAFNPQIEAAAQRSQLEVIDDVQVISEHVVEITFDAPSFLNFRAAMSYPILPKHFYSQFTPAQLNGSTALLMGSGPYRLEVLNPDDQWVPPEPLDLVRNERYWAPVRPPADRFRYLFIDNAVARLTEYENGNADITRATPEQYAEKSTDPNFVENHRLMAWTNMRSGYSIIAWNCAERNGVPTPFADARVRRAMTQLLDRWRINRDIYEGLGEVARGPFPPTQANPDIEPWPYDLDRARELLAEAGWIDRDNDGVLENERGDEFSFEFTRSAGSTVSEKVGNYLRDQCALLGIRCDIRVIDWAIGDSIRNSRDYDAFIMAWSWSSPESDPYQLFHSSQIEGQGDNFIQWSNPEADALIDRARVTIDPQERFAIWREVHQIIHEEAPYTFLLEIPWIRFVSKRVENVHAYQVGINKREWFIP